MQYTEVKFITTDEASRHMLIASLSEADFEGFEEADDALLAYVPSHLYNRDYVNQLKEEYGVAIKTRDIAEQNWNAQWEESFEAVIVPGFCTIRAAFHKMAVNTPYEVVITPKMSFGTGHHATTQLMLMRMQYTEFKGTRVLDLGTGTGILAIMAEKLGAVYTMAIDNDDWAYRNSVENVTNNGCTKIDVRQGSVEDVGNTPFDVILANINRHILLRYMTQMYELTGMGGTVIMSGLLPDDKEIVVTAAEKSGFSFVRHDLLNNWISLVFERRGI